MSNEFRFEDIFMFIIKDISTYILQTVAQRLMKSKQIN